MISLKVHGLSKKSKPNLDNWKSFLERLKNPKHEVNIGLIGKYVELKDSYKSISESFIHAGVSNETKVNVKWIHSEELTPANVADELAGLDGILVAPGFGSRGIEGKIEAVRHARENNIPFLGICLGMQLIMERGNEPYECKGLGWIEGEVKKFQLLDLNIPHMGWNTIQNLQSGLLMGISENSYMYSVHSYYANTGNQTIACSQYEHEFSAALQSDNFYGVQFHPEKSSKDGAQLLQNFLNL